MISTKLARLGALVSLPKLSFHSKCCGIAGSGPAITVVVGIFHVNHKANGFLSNRAPSPAW